MLKASVELIFSLGMFINALLFVPQVIKLYTTKQTTGFSLLTFFGFNLIQLATVLHGYLHGDTLLMLGSGLSFISCGLVTLLILYYR